MSRLNSTSLPAADAPGEVVTAEVIRQGLELAVTGQNLLPESPQEFRFSTSRRAAPCGVYGRGTWRF